MTKPRYEIMENDDGTYYVNEYTKDSEGTTRRQTIDDNLTAPQAGRLVRMMARQGNEDKKT